MMITRFKLDTVADFKVLLYSNRTLLNFSVKWKCQSLSCIWLFATLWTAARQAPLSVEFSGQEYWSGLPFPSPGDLPDPGTKPGSPVLQADSYHLSHHLYHLRILKFFCIPNGILLNFSVIAFDISVLVIWPFYFVKLCPCFAWLLKLPMTSTHHKETQRMTTNPCPLATYFFSYKNIKILLQVFYLSLEREEVFHFFLAKIYDIQ